MLPQRTSSPRSKHECAREAPTRSRPDPALSRPLNRDPAAGRPLALIFQLTNADLDAWRALQCVCDFLRILAIVVIRIKNLRMELLHALRRFRGRLQAEDKSDIDVFQPFYFRRTVRVAGEVHASIAEGQHEAASNSAVVSRLDAWLRGVVHRDRLDADAHDRLRLPLIDDIDLFAMTVHRIDHGGCSHVESG